MPENDVKTRVILGISPVAQAMQLSISNIKIDKPNLPCKAKIGFCMVNWVLFKIAGIVKDLTILNL